MMEDHGDGEGRGITELEVLRVLLPRNCEHCISGMMLPDSYDGDILTCAACGRSDFCPTPEVLAEEPAPAGAVDPVRHHVYEPRRRGARAPSIPEGRPVST